MTTLINKGSAGFRRDLHTQGYGTTTSAFVRMSAVNCFT